MYYNGLKDNVKDELMRTKNLDISSLDDLIEAAIVIDDKLYERAMEKRHSGSNRGRAGFPAHSWTGGGNRRDPDAMEIDVTQKRPKKGKKGHSKKGKQHARGDTEGPECYNCHKRGHYARDYRRKKMYLRQVNITLRKEVNIMLYKSDPTKEGRKAINILEERTIEHKKLY